MSSNSASPLEEIQQQIEVIAQQGVVAIKILIFVF
jgi:hypothetical protein